MVIIICFLQLLLLLHIDGVKNISRGVNRCDRLSVSSGPAAQRQSSLIRRLSNNRLSGRETLVANKKIYEKVVKHTSTDERINMVSMSQKSIC